MAFTSVSKLVIVPCNLVAGTDHVHQIIQVVVFVVHLVTQQAVPSV